MIAKDPKTLLISSVSRIQTFKFQVYRQETLDSITL